MVFSFSSKLIEETIKVFREENNLILSPEQANAYLNNMAGLFLSFVAKAPSCLTSKRSRREGAKEDLIYN
jgi:hypothetical protein